MIKVSEYHVAQYLACAIENYFETYFDYKYNQNDSKLELALQARANVFFVISMLEMSTQNELKEIKNLYRNYRKHVIKYNAWSDKYGDDVSFSTLLAQYLQHIFENCE